MGSFYVGQLTGAKHQVAHVPCAKSDLREARGRSLSISVVFRTTLFNDRASRRRNGTPNPWDAFAETVGAFQAAFVRRTWRLPTFEECMARCVDEQAVAAEVALVAKEEALAAGGKEDALVAKGGALVAKKGAQGARAAEEDVPAGQPDPPTPKPPAKRRRRLALKKPAAKRRRIPMKPRVAN